MDVADHTCTYNVEVLFLVNAQVLDKWVHALSACLARAGILDAHLPRMKEACR
jgi:hypothetical protein